MVSKSAAMELRLNFMCKSVHLKK